MKIRLLFLFLMFISWIDVTAQKLQTPQEFLGYKFGTQFSPHYKVVEYFKHVSSVSKNTRLVEYGKTNEGRPLLVTFVSSRENMDNLDAIRNNNMRLAGLEAGGGSITQPAIVWLSYNVHGNESVSTEAAMQTLYDLVDPSNTRTGAWLQNTVVVIDPCLNPDGRERYTSFFNQVRNQNPDLLSFTREHIEPWPGGRSNHYYFDLNRDWAWQTQAETQSRMKLYNQWHPQVHVDFHEQGINEPYFFAPAAEPFHQDITPWQREFQTLIGKNNALYFDQNGWMYFTKERFDLLYPSYGDTYPIYNGAIGMTFEQGGSGGAGLAVITSEGDTLTLEDRIAHHHTTGLSTIEVASKNASRLVNEFKNYFARSNTNPPGEYKTYVIKAENNDRVKALAKLLDKNGITYGYGLERNSSGFNYFSKRNENFQISKADMVISSYQPKSVLLKVLFEPSTFVTDSNTYDITAWALPYAYGLKAYATREVLKPVVLSFPESSTPVSELKNAVAYIAKWNSTPDVKFLSELLKKNIKVRYTQIPIMAGGKQFGEGSLIIARTSNEGLGVRFDTVVKNIATTAGVVLQGISSGMVDKGADLGSSKVRFITRPDISLVLSDETSSTAFGEVWHFFEQQLNYPISVIRSKDMARVDLNKFNVLIFPDGMYDDMSSDKMLEWVRNGGKMIAMDGAITQLIGKKGFNIKLKEEKKDEPAKDPYANLKSYDSRERDFLRTSIPGAIYKVNLDNTHPLGFGFSNIYYTLKLNDRLYQFMDKGWNIGVLKKDNYVTGFVGEAAKKKLIDGLIFGVQDMGSGSVVYLADDPLFRSFWESGKLLFSNAVFMVGQ
ncbi:MAG TPA: M14 metallopeptidase family protein [Sphingobacteriaceae bacterium]|nr:M14 metallopeptidase family protein [Sphingobacteriaceae bacterium]